jgi:Putative stress-induced transcription regulator/CGNR zinc finger
VITSRGTNEKVKPMVESLPPPIFIADAIGLDFLNSIAVPIDTEVEWIGSGKDFVAWLQAAEIVPPEILAALHKTAMPGEFDTVASQARKLREWFRGFVHAHKGKPLRPRSLQELEPLNRILIRDEEFGQIIARDTSRKGKSRHDTHEDRPVSGLVWSRQRRWRSPDALLLPIARAMADLVCDDDFTHVKACEGSTCTLLFMDRSQHGRRWCSMSICGNRAKQAAHRKRAHQRRK